MSVNSRLDLQPEERRFSCHACVHSLRCLFDSSLCTQLWNRRILIIKSLKIVEKMSELCPISTDSFLALGQLVKCLFHRGGRRRPELIMFQASSWNWASKSLPSFLPFCRPLIREASASHKDRRAPLWGELEFFLESRANENVLLDGVAFSRMDWL